MKIVSSVEYASYLRQMKDQMSSLTDFGMERLTGLIIGPFFSVTYHSGHVINRRITNEKHRAIGFVKPCEEGTQISCVRLAGMTNPISLIVIFASWLLCCLLVEPGLAFLPGVLWTGIVLTAFLAAYTAFTHSITERGQLGSKMLTAFLIDPENYYTIVNKI